MFAGCIELAAGIIENFLTASGNGPLLEGSVISMGVFIGQSTKIYDRETGNIIYGRVPKGSVVVPGSLPSSNGAYSLNCAVIVKRVDCKTLSKVGPNELLRRV